jgi:carbon-monoxide dehydrogenase large subunit
MPARILGERIKRKEDPRLIQGRGHYVDDIKLNGMLHMAFARSPYGHARITSINTESARNSPGVVAVLTSEDLKDRLGQVPCAVGMKGLKVPDHPCLAVGRVRYLGEPVVAVVATNPYLAQDAAAQVEVDYDMLPAVTNLDKALESGSPLVHEAFGDNIAFKDTMEGGDWKTVEADPAIKVIKQRLINQRLGPVAMETR